MAKKKKQEQMADDEIINLRRSVEKQAASLDQAQYLFVMSEFNTYEWNLRRIREIEMKITPLVKQPNAEPLAPDVEKRLIAERHQLVSETTSLYSHIMRQLKDTGGEEDELDAFVKNR